MDDPVADAALDWFVRRQDAPGDAALERAFRLWLGEDPRHAAAYARYDALWALPELDAASANLAVRQDRADARRASRPRRRRRAAFAAAAALLLAVGLARYPDLWLRWQADYRTAAGGRSDVTLPDGSRMMLNTASAVAVDFAEGRRSVRLLEGEAFFDVARDPDHPFRVAGTFGTVAVTGTAFAVRTDAEADTVVLERGRVEVARRADTRRAARLAAGEMVTVSATALSAVETTDPADALAWREGRIVFHEKPFTQVLNDLRRYYGGPVVTIDGRIGGLRVSGNYRLSDPEAVIRSLAEAAGVSVTRLPGGLLILR